MPSEYAKTLGARLRAIRTQQGLSLHGVEEKSRGRWKAVVVGSYERGDRSVTVQKLAELAEFYGVPVSELLPGDATPTPLVPSPKLVIDLERMGQLPKDKVGPLARYVATIQSQRGDYNGRVLSVRHEDVRMFKQHIDVYRKAWTDAGHPGEAPVYLRCPGFVAKTDAAAQEAYGPTLMRHFQNQSRLLADSSRRQNSPPDHPRWKTSQRLTEITLEETLRGSVFIGSPETVVGKLKDLQRDIGLSGVQLETNCAGLADHAAEREAIRLLAREVKSAFR